MKIIKKDNNISTNNDYQVSKYFFSIITKKESNYYIKIYFFGLQILCKKKKINLTECFDIVIKNTNVKNYKSKKRCFLIATGPSINEQNLALLKNEDCFSISNFFLHKDINIIKPKFHFFAPYHEPLILENYIDWLKLADENLPKETNIVLSVTNEYLVKEYNLFSNRNIFYLHFSEYNDQKNINVDITKSVMPPQTGPIMMLPVVAYMGYQEIYLVGQDMNRLASYGGVTSNFYKNDPRKNATDKGNWIDIIPELERTLIMFKQFKKYADYFEEHDIKFYNLSPISWLSFVEKKDFNEVLNSKEDIKHE